jgi:hypothetical protein
MSVRFLFKQILPAVALFTAVGSTYAITFGQPDGNAHPQVGTLVFVQNGVSTGQLVDGGWIWQAG